MRTKLTALMIAAIVAMLAAVYANTGQTPLAIVATWLERMTPAERAKGAGGGAPQSGPPVAVTVSQPLSRRVIEWDDYTGRADAVETVDLRARVNGYLTDVRFKDGDEVKKGDVLFIIDPRPYERTVAQSEAELEQAKVKVSNASLDVDRGRPLAARSVISQKVQDDRENIQREAEAAVKVAEAKLKLAELDLSFTRVVAPISGRVSRASVTAGNYVSGGGSQSATLLTSIVSQDPIYVYFDVSEANALKYRRMAQPGSAPPSAAQPASTGQGLLGHPAWIGLQDEQGFPTQGRLDFTDNRLDAGTGTLRARVVIDNKAGVLTPGMFARVRVAGSAEYEGLLLPDEAIATDQTSRYVLVAAEDGSVARRAVRLGPTFQGLRIVRDGVKADDWVVVRGQARIRPGQKVAPKREALTVSQAEAMPNGQAQPR